MAEALFLLASPLLPLPPIPPLHKPWRIQTGRPQGAFGTTGPFAHPGPQGNVKQGNIRLQTEKNTLHKMPYTPDGPGNEMVFPPLSFLFADPQEQRSDHSPKPMLSFAKATMSTRPKLRNFRQKDPAPVMPIAPADVRYVRNSRSTDELARFGLRGHDLISPPYHSSQVDTDIGRKPLSEGTPETQRAALLGARRRDHPKAAAPAVNAEDKKEAYRQQYERPVRPPSDTKGEVILLSIRKRPGVEENVKGSASNTDSVKKNSVLVDADRSNEETNLGHGDSSDDNLKQKHADTDSPRVSDRPVNAPRDVPLDGGEQAKTRDSMLTMPISPVSAESTPGTQKFTPFQILIQIPHKDTEYVDGRKYDDGRTVPEKNNDVELWETMHRNPKEIAIWKNARLSIADKQSKREKSLKHSDDSKHDFTSNKVSLSDIKSKVRDHGSNVRRRPEAIPSTLDSQTHRGRTMVTHDENWILELALDSSPSFVKPSANNQEEPSHENSKITTNTLNTALANDKLHKNQFGDQTQDLASDHFFLSSMSYGATGQDNDVHKSEARNENTALDSKRRGISTNGERKRKFVFGQFFLSDIKLNMKNKEGFVHELANTPSNKINKEMAVDSEQGYPKQELAFGQFLLPDVKFDSQDTGIHYYQHMLPASIEPDLDRRGTHGTYLGGGTHEKFTLRDREDANHEQSGATTGREHTESRREEVGKPLQGPIPLSQPVFSLLSPPQFDNSIDNDRLHTLLSLQTAKASEMDFAHSILPEGLVSAASEKHPVPLRQVITDDMDLTHTTIPENPAAIITGEDLNAKNIDLFFTNVQEKQAQSSTSANKNEKTNSMDLVDITFSGGLSSAPANQDMKHRKLDLIHTLPESTGPGSGSGDGRTTNIDLVHIIIGGGPGSVSAVQGLETRNINKPGTSGSVSANQDKKTSNMGLVDTTSPAGRGPDTGITVRQPANVQGRKMGENEEAREAETQVPRVDEAQVKKLDKQAWRRTGHSTTVPR